MAAIILRTQFFDHLQQNFDSSLIYIFYAALFVAIFIKNNQELTQDAVVISNTYFSDPKSGYPNITMALLFSGPKALNISQILRCISKNETTQITRLAKIRYALGPIDVCKWTTYLLTCPVVKNPQMFAITGSQFNSEIIEIPYRRAVEKPLGVVACFSPLFYNERWQLLIPTLEIYRQLGVELQNFYVQSMIKEIFDFLRVYENQDIARITIWNQFVLDAQRLSALGYNPNVELEWRSQATAHTDCFLHYKQSAEFIIISDIDDILFPKLGDSYLSELRLLSSNFPNASSFSYSRYKTEVSSTVNHEHFSLSALVNSARISRHWEDDKYVVVPKHVESTWLHFPVLTDSGYTVHRVDNTTNIMVHLRNWTMIDYRRQRNAILYKKQFRLFERQIGHYLNVKTTDKLEQNFRKFLHDYAQEEFERLPKDVRYYPLIEQCYIRIFYGRSKKAESCPGPLRCELPPVEGLRCAVAQKEYQHKQLNHLKWHFPIDDGTFVINENGCTM